MAVDEGHGVDAYLAWVPKSDLRLEDTWHTVGMRGTGSHTWAGEDVFVPEHRLVASREIAESSAQSDGALCRLPFAPVGAMCVLGVVLGLGRAALDHTIEKASSKAMHHTFFERQSDSVAVQVRVAEAALRVDTAILHIHREADELDLAAQDGITLDYATRARFRAINGYAAQQVLEAIQLLLNVHGAGSFAESCPLQRFWRDANVAGRHAGHNDAVGYEVFGKSLLGVSERITPMV